MSDATRAAFAAAVELHDVPDDGTIPTPPPLPITSLRRLVADHPALRSPLVHGLLRVGETLNVIAAPKCGKSWLLVDLILAVLMGAMWLGRFRCERGRVLLVDNELHGETLARRIPKVADALGYPLDAVADGLDVVPLRGKLRDLPTLLDALDRQVAPGSYALVVVDAWYRCLPVGTDECDNGAIAALFNRIDQTADRLGCAFALVHHTSKGIQSGKSVTDVGSGAGSMSRAADAHLVLRPHEADGAVVVDAVVRSWEPVPSLCLRWQYPTWTLADDLDPTELRGLKRRKREATADAPPVKESPPEWTPQMFADAFLATEPRTKASIIDAAVRAKLSQAKAGRLLDQCEEGGLAHRWHDGPRRPIRFGTIPQPQLVDA